MIIIPLKVGVDWQYFKDEDIAILAVMKGLVEKGTRLDWSKRVVDPEGSVDCVDDKSAKGTVLLTSDIFKVSKLDLAERWVQGC